MRINYNESAILSNACVNAADSKLSLSIERLSSGYKINHARDNPAGLAISHKMNAQIRGLSQAKDNTNDGISVVETADGALEEVTAILQRMNQLSLQAGTDSTLDADRELINAEIKQLKSEVTRIASDTQFNGQVLLDGTFDLKGYTSNEDVTVEYYSDEVKKGKYSINMTGLVNADGSVNLGNITGKDGFKNLHNITAEGSPLVLDGGGDVVKKGSVTIKADGNFEMTIEYSKENTGLVDLDITGIGAMKIQAGANEGQEIAIRIPTISLSKMGIEDLDVSTMEGAQSGIESIKNALAYISDARSRLGAYENRMEHNTTNIDVTNENMTASYSRIMDVDMAEEMTEYSSQQVILQASISMLSQANEKPQQVLQLLQ